MRDCNVAPARCDPVHQAPLRKRGTVANFVDRYFLPAYHERMLNYTTILAAFLAVGLGLPPEWCRSLTICPLACCRTGTARSCTTAHDAQPSDQLPDCCHHKQERKPAPCDGACRCGKRQIMKPSDEVASVADLPASAFCVAPAPNRPHGGAGPGTTHLPRNLQKMLCRWAC